MQEKKQESMLRILKMLKYRICCSIVNPSLNVVGFLFIEDILLRSPKKAFKRVSTISIFE